MLGVVVALGVVGVVLALGVSSSEEASRAEQPPETEAQRQERLLAEADQAAEAERKKASAEVQARADEWTGEDTLFCRANERMTVQGKTATADIHATDNCRLTLIDCNLTGDPPLYVNNQAIVTIEGGTLTGDGYAIRLMNSAKATIRKTRIWASDSAVRVDGDGELVLHDVTIEHRQGDRGLHRSPWPSGLDLWDNARVGMSGGSIRWPWMGVRADRDNALLALRNVNVRVEIWDDATGPGATLALGKSATAAVVGGSLVGTGAAVRSEDLSHLELRNVKIEGKVEVGPNATMERIDAPVSADAEGAEPDAAPVEDESLESMLSRLSALREKNRAAYEQHYLVEQEACTGVQFCTNEAGLKGAVSGKVISRTDETGTLVSVRSTGSLAGKVGLCLRERRERRTIDGYAGGPGTLTCEYSGKLGTGMSMTSTSATFVRDKPKQ